MTSTDSISDSSRVRSLFRAFAIAEAVSWAGLLVAMVLKWIVQDDPHAGLEGGVPIMGPIHGGMFIGYVVMCFVARHTFGWTPRATTVALAASIPPFLTAAFEVAADRRGMLTVDQASVSRRGKNRRASAQGVEAPQ